jgi:predicted dehydrogenase
MNKTWQDLKGLVVGFGSAGCRHLRILRELGLRHVAVCDPDEERRARAQDEFGIPEVFCSLEQGLRPKPRLVFICSPTAAHAEQAAQGLEAGADVFVEKPLSTDVRSIDRLTSVAKQSDQIVMVGHCFRFHEGLRKAKGWLTEGRIGRLVAVRASMGEYIPEVMPNYRSMYIAEYSGAYELVHDLDLALWYATQRPVRVFGIDGIVSDVGIRSPDLVEILIEFKDRCVASVHLDFFQRARRRQTELLGTEGTIIVEFGRWDECNLSLYQSSSGEWFHEKLHTDRDDMFRDEDRAFLEAVVNRLPTPLGLDEGRLAVEVTVAAQRSARSGKAVTLEEPTKRPPRRKVGGRPVSRS